MHDDTTLRKYQIDATERIYQSLTMKDMKIHRYGESSLRELLPTLKSQ